MKKQDYTEEIKNIESLLVKLKDNHVEPPVKPIYLKQKIEFEVYPESSKTKYNFKEAADACKLLGKGWRLPTRVELLLMYENKDEIKGFDHNYHWSSTEYDSYDAWVQSFEDGGQGGINKDDFCNFIAVRNINH